jgi:hypothetical protein
MIPEYFAVIGAVIASVGGIYYLYQTIRGKTKPNRITWILWGLFPMIVFVAQRAQGVEGLSWASFVAGFTPFLVFAASFLNKKAFWQTKSRDYVLMAAGFIGIILWAITDDPNLAIFFALLADLFAAIPTIIKCYTDPETESWVAYGISSLGFGLGVLAIQTYDFENTAFIVYLFVANGLMAVLSSRKRPKEILGTEIE